MGRGQTPTPQIPLSSFKKISLSLKRCSPHTHTLPLPMSHTCEATVLTGLYEGFLIFGILPVDFSITNVVSLGGEGDVLLHHILVAHLVEWSFDPLRGF